MPQKHSYASDGKLVRIVPYVCSVDRVAPVSPHMPFNHWVQQVPFRCHLLIGCKHAVQHISNTLHKHWTHSTRGEIVLGWSSWVLLLITRNRNRKGGTQDKFRSELDVWTLVWQFCSSVSFPHCSQKYLVIEKQVTLIIYWLFLSLY